MADITTRAGKGSPLTNAEVDANFTNLNNDKLEADSLSVVTTDPSGAGALTYSNAVFTFTPANVSGGGSGLVLDDSALSPNNGDVLQFDAVIGAWKAVPVTVLVQTFEKFVPLNSADLQTFDGNIFYART